MADTLLGYNGLQNHNATLRNDTGYGDLSSEIYTGTGNSAMAAIIMVEKVALPVICLFGLIGNTLSTMTFMRQSLRRAPCSLYLAARGISDNGFLLSLFMIWVSSTFNLRLSQIRGVCQSIVFITYLCGCVSVWLCVFITFENFLLIHKPFLCRGGASDNVSKICIGILVLVSIGIYHMSLWTVNTDCSHNPEYVTLTEVMVYTDTLLTLVIPTLVIFVLLSVIAYKVLRILHIRRLHSTLIEKLTNGKRPSKQVIPIAKVTKMLFVVSLTFFALNVPSHAIRLRILIETFTKGGTATPMIQRTLQSVFLLMYYLSFSINIIVYATFGSNFRRTFMNTFYRRRKPRSSRFMPREAVNRVHHRRVSINFNLDYLDTNDTRQCLMNTEDLPNSQLSIQ